MRATLLELEGPDEESRTPDEGGRRIVRLDEHRAWGWRVVNYIKYRDIKSEQDRRESNRLAQARWREKHKGAESDVSNSKQPSSSDKRPSAQSAHVDVDVASEVDGKDQEHVQPKAARATPVQSLARFDEFWDVYPVRKGKADAMAKWKAKGYDKIADQIIGDVVKRKAHDRQWRDGYAPHGSTYINARGWEDDVESEKPSAKAAPAPGSAEDYFLRAD